MVSREILAIDPQVVNEINRYIVSEENRLINDLLEVLKKYGSPEEINRKARNVRDLGNVKKRLREMGSPYLRDLEWLEEQRDRKRFVSIGEFRRKVLGDKAEATEFNEKNAPTLEISALQYFPWLIKEAEVAIEKGDLMPGRYIRVRKMKEQETDKGELFAICGAMQIIGASWVETLDTKGTDGSNVHLGGPETITGYFGGVGQPNEYALKWIDEYLYYYTNYGIQEVLNVNFGTILLGLLLYKLGVDIKFKISVYVGHDNPYFLFMTMLLAKLLSRPDGSTAIAGINLSNSVNTDTIEIASEVRYRLGFEEIIRFEHHITEAWKSIVRQPYSRREDLLRIAPKVPNISAKHEGGDVDVERSRAHPSDILDYFRDRDEIVASGEMELLEQNYLDKHDAVNETAKALTKIGIGVVAARNLHYRS